jgi:hypothetical protein
MTKETQRLKAESSLKYAWVCGIIRPIKPTKYINGKIMKTILA